MIGGKPRPFAETTRQTFKGDINHGAVRAPRAASMNNKGVEGVPLSAGANYCMQGISDADMRRGYCDEGKVGAASKSDPKDFA